MSYITNKHLITGSHALKKYESIHFADEFCERQAGESKVFLLSSYFCCFSRFQEFSFHRDGKFLWQITAF